jgi:hypothetical protein
VNTSLIGSYTLTYNVSDAAGNVAVTVTRTVNVSVIPPSISIASIRVLEGSGGGASNFDFTVTLSAASAAAITVDYTTSDGTALSASDYTATAATLTIPAGVTTATITVLVNADAVHEANDTFTLTLSNPLNATIATAAATGTIMNDDVGGLNDTGKNTWANVTSDAWVIAKPLYPNQDADRGRDAQALAGTLVKTGMVFIGLRGDEFKGFDMTKLDAAGLPLPPTGTQACMQDHVTGLMWEVKTTTAGLRQNAHLYTWYDSNPATNGGNAGTVSSPGASSCGGTLGSCNTEAFVTAVNAVGLCGFTDWRLPSRGELLSIMDLSYRAPSNQTVFFPNIARGAFLNSYATSTSGATTGGGTNTVISVDFNYGQSGTGLKGFLFHVRLVRGGL